MDSELLLALMQQATPAAPQVTEVAKDWVTMQFSVGDLTSVGGVIAAYVALRERLTRLETKMDPIWRWFNQRHGERREE